MTKQTKQSTLLKSVLVLLGALGLAAGAEAQYFGRTPVQWERFDFQILKTEHFDVYYYAEGKQAAEQAGRLAERWYTRLSRMLDFQLPDRQALILYASSSQFQQTNTVGGAPGEGTGGVTEAFKRRIVLPVGVSLDETDHVLGHELVHAFQYAITGQGKIVGGNYPSALRMPLWFIEGMAEYLSVGPVDPHTAMWLRDAARKEKLPSIKDLDNPKYFPYRYGQALWAFIAGRNGDAVVAEMLKAVGPRTNDALELFPEVMHIDHEKLTKEWHAAIRNAQSPIIAGKKDADNYGPALVTEKKQGGNLNVGPALSPNGERLAFLSERDLFSIELFLQDTATGGVVKQLSKSATDPHLESLQFINSAGSFDRSGKRIAMAAVNKGRPLLVILDAETGKRIREVPLPKLGEIFTPSFAPDGNRLVFSALVDGFSDLFVYDLEKADLKRLTSDAFADFQPAWSPDGKTIAFVTDRYSTRLADLAEGNYRLAAIDVASGDARPLAHFDRGKHINPQWSASGDSLYFVSDATGISNLFRIDLKENEIFQITDLVTGVSGITATSPALSVAAATNKLAYSVYDEGRYEIYSIKDPDRLAGWPARLDDTRNAALIPGGKPIGAVLEARADAQTGLAEQSTFEQKPYKAKLGLDFVGQPYVAAGVSRYGAGFSGGIAMSFSDMLGEHNLYTVIQADRIQGFTDLGALVSYVNKKHRLNWGVQGGQIPYVAGGFGSNVTTQGGQVVYQEQTLLQRQIDRSVSLVGYYPFNPSFRVEAQAGFRNISFKNRVTTDSYNYRTGQFIGTTSEDLPSSNNLNLSESSVGVVRDTSVFGATSPVMGQRFRFEVSPTLGTINYTGALADFRQYFHPAKPLTLAARVMHYGRYGSGGEDRRLVPLFIGYADMVRGYDTNSFDVTECGANVAGSCPVYDQLLGSKLLVANFEARFPLLALFGAKNMYGPIPVEIGGFFDAGVAWDSASKPQLFGGERKMVKSVGATARVNMFGFAVLQFDYAFPLDRPGKKHTFQFNLLAGF